MVEHHDFGNLALNQHTVGVPHLDLVEQKLLVQLNAFLDLIRRDEVQFVCFQPVKQLQIFDEHIRT